MSCLMFFKTSTRVGVAKLWLAGHIQPTDRFDPACQTILFPTVDSSATALAAACLLLNYLPQQAASMCCSPLLKTTTTHLGQLHESTGEFGRSAQGTPKLTIKKLRPARFRSTSRSVLLSDESVFTHGFINTMLSTATFYLLIQTTRVYYSIVYWYTYRDLLSVTGVSTGFILPWRREKPELSAAS